MSTRSQRRQIRKLASARARPFVLEHFRALAGCGLLVVAAGAGLVIASSIQSRIVVLALVVVMLLLAWLGVGSYSDSWRADLLAAYAGARTAIELDEMVTSGWRVIDRVAADGGVVEHVAVGPAGVLTVRTAVATRPWNLTADGVDGADGGPNAALRRIQIAEMQRINDAVRQLLVDHGMDVPVVPTLLLWGTGAPVQPGGQKVVDGVAVLMGKQAEIWRRDLQDRRLDDATIAAVCSVLAPLGNTLSVEPG
ncbi:MAG: hypothetical protein JWL73_3622 [Actinomycetia bacterium]|nr:hypothetical protein [Actinomycetes bacterium]